MSRPRVVVVDDHALFRAGVITELGEELSVVAEADDIEAAVAAIDATRPDVVLLDVHLPSGSGREVIERSRGLPQPPQFLALSVSDSADTVIELVRAGARGYVTKSISAAELVDAVRRVAEGDAVFSPRLAGFVLDAFTGPVAGVEDSDPDLDRLTDREREVMRYLARGYAYKEIGFELGISVKTVESHASAVLRKLQLSSRGALTRWAAARNLL
ncbi:MAG: response regulator transcription factor [Gaiellales bacterium]